LANEILADGFLLGNTMCPLIKNFAPAQVLAEFASSLTSCAGIDDAPAVYIAIVANGGFLGNSFGSVALAYDSKGQDACIATGCYGGGPGGGGSGGVVLGLALMDNINNLPGPCKVVDFDVNVGPGFGFGIVMSDDADEILGFQVALGVGVAFNIGSLSQCTTELLNYDDTAS
jgi:hypothetical protein